MTEIYKDIKDLEGKYQVSNFGQILSLNYRKTGKAELLKPGKTKDGYPIVILYKDGKKKTFTIHRLVAETFLPNPNNLLEVNHKDEDKTNNSVDNLEWCTREYNINYGTHNERMSKTKKKTVNCQNPYFNFRKPESLFVNGLQQGSVKETDIIMLVLVIVVKAN